jgi:hypothetical protein
MYNVHPAFDPPPSEAVLWRYTDFTKFLSFLDSGKLWFASVDTLGDLFEGSNSALDAESPAYHWAAELKGLTPSERKIQEAMGFAPRTHQEIEREVRENMGRFTMVNCWCMSDEESDALWRVYASPQSGIALKTTLGAFSKSLICPEEVFVGVVHYIDYHKERIPQLNRFHRYLRKRLAFEHEHEVRAVHLHVPGTINPNTHQYEPDSTGQGLSGKYLQVDIPSLVSKVVVAPFAPDWFLAMTKSVVYRYGFKFPVVRSNLSEGPID